MPRPAIERPDSILADVPSICSDISRAASIDALPHGQRAHRRPTRRTGDRILRRPGAAGVAPPSSLRLNRDDSFCPGAAVTTTPPAWTRTASWPRRCGSITGAGGRRGAYRAVETLMNKGLRLLGEHGQQGVIGSVGDLVVVAGQTRNRWCGICPHGLRRANPQPRCQRCGP